ncbi:LOW QUALITY PROTEIN: hypothetical protein IFM46972_10117 [Aspergillus udagawae]|uniref:Uncharacterized protein n=1 Tax=Aspergillus udagawae TaxID=91492 RepID=A0A8H3SAL2_9EURO|nr:LOW QUALITY PROTEIN: hypothetical protein IFM46972_10117 [Aspergillus udagawae]
MGVKQLSNHSMQDTYLHAVLAQTIKPASAHQKERHVGMRLRDSVDSSVRKFPGTDSPVGCHFAPISGISKAM